MRARASRPLTPPYEPHAEILGRPMRTRCLVRASSLLHAVPKIGCTSVVGLSARGIFGGCGVEEFHLGRPPSLSLTLTLTLTLSCLDALPSFHHRTRPYQPETTATPQVVLSPQSLPRTALSLRNKSPRPMESMGRTSRDRSPGERPVQRIVMSTSLDPGTTPSPSITKNSRCKLTPDLIIEGTVPYFHRCFSSQALWCAGLPISIITASNRNFGLTPQLKAASSHMHYDISQPYASCPRVFAAARMTFDSACMRHSVVVSEDGPKEQCERLQHYMLPFPSATS